MCSNGSGGSGGASHNQLIIKLALRLNHYSGKELKGTNLFPFCVAPNLHLITKQRLYRLGRVKKIIAWMSLISPAVPAAVADVR